MPGKEKKCLCGCGGEVTGRFSLFIRGHGTKIEKLFTKIKSGQLSQEILKSKLKKMFRLWSSGSPRNFERMFVRHGGMIKLRYGEMLHRRSKIKGIARFPEGVRSLSLIGVHPPRSRKSSPPRLNRHQNKKRKRQRFVESDMKDWVQYLNILED